MIYNDYHLWIGGESAIGIPLYRIAGVYSKANGEFSTKPFSVPQKALHLNASALLNPPGKAGLPNQAYIMVEVLDNNGKTIPGYEKEKCLFMDKDGIRLPLLWRIKDTSELAGQTVQLRFYLRDATIYSVGAY